MKMLKNAWLKWGSVVAAFALMIGTSSVNAACLIWAHQPEVPTAMNRFKK